ncbi:MAG: glycoside hydrolase family 13 protein [Clostridiales bacterium]|nr:glycoside hydrolase family 13 protein [Clostridiales bacterium]
MPDQTIYDSRDLRCKEPYGAVPAGTQVRFTLRPARAEGFSRATLTAYFEFDNNRMVTLPMPWTGTDLGRDEFTCTLDTGDYVGLVWYTFRLEGLDGRMKQLRTYQLTVYDGADRVPDWFGKGMCYQIFPDRFFRTEIPDPAGLVGNRSVHQSWDEEPLYKPIGKTERGMDICNRDFFGGNLKGVEAKLDYLAGLGVETIYFCPIFEASENHRYGTADYSRVDPMLGTNEDFTHLCGEAHKRGIKIVLDGVFNHTGYVSRYFNGDGFYPEPGAVQSKDSPYYDWFDWKEWPDKYESWWGIYSLPAVREDCQGYRDFIFAGENSVVRRWLRAGADGWRLDVADELPDDFVNGIHQAAREENPNAIVIGEVWEDGSTKIAYGVRRRHLLGYHLDGLMNYPFRTALLNFLLHGDGAGFQYSMEDLRENYPPSAFYSAMNALGTHDTLRILTYLGVGSERHDQSKDWRAGYEMSPRERAGGMELLKLGLLVLFAFPGAPTVFYGDEAGMTGFEDPFNRRPFPWGREDKDLVAYCAKLGNYRKTSRPLREGDIRWGTCGECLVSFVRRAAGESVAVAVSNARTRTIVELPWGHVQAVDVFTGQRYLAMNGKLRLTLPPRGGILLESAPEGEKIGKITKKIP